MIILAFGPIKRTRKSFRLRCMENRVINDNKMSFWQNFCHSLQWNMQILWCWRNFHHWLHWKLSFWQLMASPWVAKMTTSDATSDLSKWRHFHFRVGKVTSIFSFHWDILPNKITWHYGRNSYKFQFHQVLIIQVYMIGMNLNSEIDQTCSTIVILF